MTAADVLFFQAAIKSEKNREGNRERFPWMHNWIAA